MIFTKSGELAPHEHQTGFLANICKTCKIQPNSILFFPKLRKEFETFARQLKCSINTLEQIN